MFPRRQFLLQSGVASVGVAAWRAATAAPSIEQGIADLRQKHSLSSVWFRLERPNAPPVQVSLGGAKPDELVGIGSISKSVTGIATALLIQQGRLEIDARLGDLLPAYFAKRSRRFDSSLAPITIRRLLTHTAGLKPNHITDPYYGIRNDKIMPYLTGRRHFFDYLTASGGDVSDGRTTYLYSNLSFLMLGLVIEAVSGEDYQAFCRRAVLQPLGIADANIPPTWEVIAPFCGWFMSAKDVLTLWNVFDSKRPTLLTGQTLARLIENPLASPVRADLTYALGAFIRRSPAGYVLVHNGRADIVPNTQTYLSYVQKIIPGPAWFISTSPIQDLQTERAIVPAINKLIE